MRGGNWARVPVLPSVGPQGTRSANMLLLLLLLLLLASVGRPALLRAG